MKISNTLSGQKEEFVPMGDEVRMYVCGITPQSEAHIGHAMSYINFDMIRRYLEYRGYKVRHIQNITDIEDKIINKAAVLGIPPQELAEKIPRASLRIWMLSTSSGRMRIPLPPGKSRILSLWSGVWWIGALPMRYAAASISG